MFSKSFQLIFFPIAHLYILFQTCSNKNAFLITQMPLPTTVTDFWRLVYDQHATNIVMVNNTSDDDDVSLLSGFCLFY